MEKYSHIRVGVHESRPLHSATIILCGSVRLIQWEFPNLAAPFWRWYVDEDPGAFIIVQNKRISLTPGRVFLIPPHTPFLSGVKNPVTHTYLHFTLDVGHMTTPGVVFSHRSTPLEDQFRHDLVRELKRTKSQSPIVISLTANTLINLALSRVSAKYWLARASDTRINDSIRKIQDSYPAALKNEELARGAGMNVNAFTQFFRQRTGRSPRQFLLRLRIEETCSLLQKGETNLDKIAEQTGFCDRFHFSKAFKQQMRVSPGAFRRAQLGK